jgi:CheY-like chemotaxis protein
MSVSAFSAPASTDVRDGMFHRRLRGVVALVVDDDEDVRDCLRDALRGFGAAVMVARSAREARDAVLLAPPDLLFSDISMPGEDGIELITSIRRMDRGTRVRAIAVSARAGALAQRRALAGGFDRFVEKPFGLASLLRAAVELLPQRD